MAPIELNSLSSNWKKLQKAIQPSPKSKSSAKADVQDDPKSLKRKRPTKLSGERAKEPKGSFKATKLSATRKRQKMEEPASVGASTRHHDAKSLSRSVSMPSLKQKPLPVDPEDIEKSVSILAPSPHHPDNENEGVSETALPGKYIALDCEMVGTGPEPDRDSALARVSVVNYHGHQVYDSYVQVKVPVTDFRTAVSGIEPKHLRKDYARPFKQVHDDLKTLLEGRILVGHAVKHDLDVLMLKHDKRFIRDTSKYSKFRELATIPGRTPRLKTLAEKLLGVEIQVGAHSSVEDARATMALFRLEKEGFDQEVIKIYGHARMSIPSARADAGADAVEDQSNRKPKNKKKKKKKN
ncbi:RNA exonuclease 4 [Corynespora cassiicola Philippines]|uniref:RNA exonuclease 4 n=1 Tax=Corynespora cassiicola Philippines TaxID=1448308 RepID=A0A2T2NBA9_CORCC|nr:RNA exonuclease 4 [Corynespora cassiicola Philippines]